MGVLPDYMIERDVKIEPFAPQQHRPGLVSYGVTSYGYDCRLGYVFDVFKPYPAEVIDPKNFNKEMLERVDLTPIHEWNQGYYPEGANGPPVQHCIHCKKGRPWSNRDEVDGCTGKPNFILIPPHSFVLGESLETFTIPRDCLAVVLGKSTYARCGLIVNVTPLEPEWHGKVTIELSNTTPLPMKVYAGEGIMQILFLRSDGPTERLRRTITTLIGGLKDMTEFRRRVSETQTVFFNTMVEDTCKVSYADKKGKYQSQTGLTHPVVNKE